MPNKLPLNIAIDSSILRKDLSFSNTDMLYLKELSKLKLIKLHFPWFVFKECSSYSIDAIQKDLKQIEKILSDLSKKGLHKRNSLIANEISIKLDFIKKDVEASVESVWNEYVNETVSLPES